MAFSETKRPLVFWNVTHQCNLSCPHCYINATTYGQRDELTLSEARELIDDLAEMEIPLLMLSGGEPLIRKDFWQIVFYAHQKGLRAALSSNGTLITREVVRKIKNAGVEYVGISLDGANAETHDAIRGISGSFQKAVKALKYCVDAGVKCGVRVTATIDNYREIPDLLDLAAKLKIPRFCLYWLVPSGRGRGLYTDRSLGTQEIMWILEKLYMKAYELKEKMEILTVDAPQDGAYILERLKDDDPQAFQDALKLLQFTGDSCSAGGRMANIDPCGNIYVCQFAQSDELKVGNIREKKFSEVWSDTTNPILSMFRNKIKKLKGKCSKCVYKQICGGGCRIRAYFHYNDLWAEDPLCPYAHKQNSA